MIIIDHQCTSFFQIMSRSSELSRSWQVVEGIREQLPHLRTAIGTHAFVKEAIDLRNLASKDPSSERTGSTDYGKCDIGKATDFETGNNRKLPPEMCPKHTKAPSGATDGRHHQPSNDSHGFHAGW